MTFFTFRLAFASELDRPSYRMSSSIDERHVAFVAFNERTYEGGRELRRRRKLPPEDVEGGELEAPEEAGGFGFAARARLLLDELPVARPPKLNRLHGKENRRVRC